MADREVKRAVEGISTDKPNLPPCLCKPLPMNSTAVKRARDDALKKEWETSWRESDRVRKSARIDTLAPSKTFLKTVSQNELSRADASQIAQLRLAHIPLNQYLKKIRKVDSVRCPACGYERETI
jgi:hypothetical protein